MAVAVVRADCALATFSPVSREALALTTRAITHTLIRTFAIKVSFVPVIGTTGTSVTIRFVKEFTAATNDIANTMDNIVLSRKESSVRIMDTITVQVTSRTVNKGTTKGADTVTAI
jgi:hypothetical protein